MADLDALESNYILRIVVYSLITLAGIVLVYLVGSRMRRRCETGKGQVKKQAPPLKMKRKYNLDDENAAQK